MTARKSSPFSHRRAPVDPLAHAFILECPSVGYAVQRGRAHQAHPGVGVSRWNSLLERPAKQRAGWPLPN